AETPYDVAISAQVAAQLFLYEREYEQAEGWAGRGLALSDKGGFRYVASLSRGALGHALAQQGRSTEGIALIRDGISGLLQLGSRLGITFWWNALAAAQERAGLISEALEAIKEAAEANPDEIVHRSETLRIRGELRLKRGQSADAEKDFRDAIVTAHSMGAL